MDHKWKKILVNSKFVIGCKMVIGRSMTIVGY